MKSPANFYLVGASKAGTTSLCNYLGQHPQIYMSPVKEPNFFAEEVRFSNFDEAMQRQALASPDFRLRGPAETWPDYLKLFDGVSGQTAIGEASASYLWSPTAPGNIARARPDAKILIILRNPVDRAFAQYLHMLSFADRPVTFREHMDQALACMASPTAMPQAEPAALPPIPTAPLPAVRAALPSAVPTALPSAVPAAPPPAVSPPNSSAMLPSRDREEAVLNPQQSKRIGELYPFLEYGLYAEQVKRYQSLFPRNQISIHLYEDYQQDPRVMMKDIFCFLEVEPDFTPDMTERHMQARVPKSWAAKRWMKQLGVWNLARALAPKSIKKMVFQKREAMKLGSVDRARLVDYYRADVESLSPLLNRALTHWLVA